VPRDEWLAEADLGDELRDGRLAGRQAADDPQPVDVRERLVDDAQLTEVLGREDGAGDRAADVGAGRAQGNGSGAATVGSTALYINED